MKNKSSIADGRKKKASNRGRPTKAVQRYKYAIALAQIHWKFAVPKRFRTPEVFGIILSHELAL